MIRAVLTILFLSASVGLADSDSVAPDTKGNKRTPATSTYGVDVRGSFSGDGQAIATGNSITITGTVTSSTGERGDLSFTGLAITGSRFSGTGTVLGKTATINGRVDAPQGDNARGFRIVASFTADDNQRGRIVGSASASLPDDPSRSSGDSDKD